MAVIEGDDLGITKISIGTGVSLESTVLNSEIKEAKAQIQDYFSGSRKTFSLQLNLSGTTFQKEVWALLREIPFGKTLTYLELAKRLGGEKYTRAVASANAHNPAWIVIPCHRIIGSDGNLTGYAGGLWRKKWLLDHESQQTNLFSCIN